jgi:hypothetical protein
VPPYFKSDPKMPAFLFSLSAAFRKGLVKEVGRVVQLGMCVCVCVCVCV